MKSNYYIFLVFIIVLSCCKKSDFAEIELFDKIAFNESIKHHPLKIFNNQSAFNKNFDKKNKSIYKLYDQLRTLDYDFKNFDYVFSFGKKLDKLEFSEKLTKNKDHCKYLDKIPVFPVYGEINEEIVFIYKLRVKNKYRHQCP